MKKYFSKILIAIFILGFFLAPVSVNNNNLIKKELLAQPAFVPVYGTNGEVIGSMSPVDYSSESKDKNFEFGCSGHPRTWFTNCLLGFFYYVVFQPLAFFAALAAKLLDYFIFYSINDNSYKDNFIELGWVVIRDLANVFFIIALMYVALKTVLGLNSSNNKRLIGMIIGIALIINFSLFITKVVIDTSNVLAHIFYSNIESQDGNGKVLDPGHKGEKSISKGLVAQFDPQKIFGKNEIGNDNNDKDKKERTVFFILLFSSIGLMIYMIFMFLSVAFLFVARTITLWILMIFSPIAFASYTIPALSIPKFGNKEWWSELLKNAFLAPIFLLFLYIILLMTKVTTLSTQQKLGEDIGSYVDNFEFFMDVFIPFILLYVLLMSLKKVAIKLSGEMGQAVNSVAKTAGGLALGAAAGGLAFGGTKLLGGVGNYLSKREGIKNWGTKLVDEKDEEGNVIGKKRVNKEGIGGWASRGLGRGILTKADSAKKGTWDLRQSGLGNLISSKTGLDMKSGTNFFGLGPKSGGLEGKIERENARREEVKELYKTKMSDEETTKWSLNRLEDYNDRRQQAQKNNMNMEEWDKKNAKPIFYTTADALNKERERIYTESIGKNDLLSSLAHTLTPEAALVNENNYVNAEGSFNEKYKKKLKKKKRREAMREAYDKNENFDGAEWDKKFEEKINTFSSVAKHKDGIKEEDINNNKELEEKYKKDREEKEKELEVEKREAIETANSLGLEIDENAYKLDETTFKKEWVEKTNKENINSYINSEFVKYDKEIVDQINEQKKKNVKILLGAVAGIALGAGVGAALASAGTLVTPLGGLVSAGTTATIGAGAGGAIGAGSSAVKDESIERFVKAQEKSVKAQENLQKVIGDLKTIIQQGQNINDINTKGSGVITGYDPKGIKEEIREPLKLFNEKNQVIQDKVVERLSHNEILQTEMLETLKNNNNKLTDQQKDALRKNLVELKKEQSILQGLKSAEEKLYKLTGQQGISKASSSSSTSSSSK